MPEAKGLPQPFTIAGIEVPVRRGFRFDQARKIFDDMQNAMTTHPEANPTDTLVTYLTAQGIQTVEQVKLLRTALDTPLARRKNPFTEADRAIISSLIDITGRLNMPERLPRKDLGPKETARDLGRGRLRLPRK